MLTISLEHDSISFSIEIWIHHIKVSNYFQNLMGTRTSECTQLSQIFLISVYLLNSNQVPTQNVTFCFVFKDHKTNTSRQTDRPTQKPPQCTKSAIEHNQCHKFMPPLIAKQMKKAKVPEVPITHLSPNWLLATPIHLLPLHLLAVPR